MPAFNIAANQQLAQPVSSFFQGKAMALAEQNQARKAQIEEERLVREREAFELDKESRAAQEARALKEDARGDAEWAQAQAHKMLMDPIVEAGLEGIESGKGDPVAHFDYMVKAYPELHAKAVEQYDLDGNGELTPDELTPEKAAEALRMMREARAKLQPKKEDFTLGPDQVRFDAGGSIIASNPKAADKDPDFIKKNKYYKNVLENQDNFTPEEIAQANRHFLGSGQKVTITTDEFGNAQVTIAEGTNELTTSTASKVQQEIIAAQTSLDELDGMLQKDWSEVPPWAYGSTGEFTQKISAVFQQLDLPFKKWVKGTLNPSDAVEMRTQSIIFGGKVISMVTGETGRFTDKERELAFKAAGVMTSPNSEPEQVLTAMQTVRPLLVNYLERRQRALVEGMDDTELEMERLRSEIKQMGGAPDA